MTDDSLALSTVLGSCISVCIYDHVQAIGGMNHFMLPGEGKLSMRNGGISSMMYGANAMEQLVNGLLKYGAVRERLVAKVFGGGMVVDQIQHIKIGERNVEFVNDYLTAEGIPIKSSDVLGTSARKIVFSPRSGKVYLKKIAKNNVVTKIAKFEAGYESSINRQDRVFSNVEWFD
ncbi:chemoreceptor glutamine deamidase CheD [Chromobacterium amazonense]|uniref:chemoreceptor glutamine deamidase CheD n=1 Tax=Chromobacterium amazonense TaxID=1382803 RepID=UPI0031F6697E